MQITFQILVVKKMWKPCIHKVSIPEMYFSGVDLSTKQKIYVTGLISAKELML